MTQQETAPGPALSKKVKPVRVTTVGSEINLFFPSAAFPVFQCQLWVGLREATFSAFERVRLH